jgi:hypothetical protein
LITLGVGEGRTDVPHVVQQSVQERTGRHLGAVGEVVSAGRLLTARSASSVNAAHSPGTHLTSPPQGSAHQQHRGGGLRVLEENPKPPSCRPATSSGSSTFANSSSGRSTHPPTVSRRRCARSIAETLVREGEAARRVSACHRQPAMVEVPARSAVIAVWWVCLAAGAWRGSRRLNGVRSATTTRRSPPCCSQLCTL